MLLYCRPAPCPAHLLLPAIPAAHLSVWKRPSIPPCPFSTRLSVPQWSVVSVLHLCGSSDCLVFLLDVAVPFSPSSDSVSSHPTCPCPAHAAACHCVRPCSVLPLTITFPLLLSESKGGCFYSSGRKKMFVNLL